MRRLCILFVLVAPLVLTACQVRVTQTETTTVTTAGPETTTTVTAPATTITETLPFIIDTYFDPEEQIVALAGKDFAIVFYSVQRLNLYRWEVSYDEDMLALTERTWKYYEGQGSPWDEGKEWFIFKALKPGNTDITFTYLQSNPPGSVLVIEKKIFKVNITVQGATVPPCPLLSDLFRPPSSRRDRLNIQVYCYLSLMPYDF